MRYDHDEPPPTEVVVSRIDVPFLELTWFFIKASLAMALAFSVTSWLWVLIGTAIVSLSAGLLFVLGIPALLLGNPAPPPPAEVRAVEVPAEVPAALAPAEQPSEGAVPAQPPAEPEAPTEAAQPETPPAPTAPRDPHREATEAAQRAELERLRRERQQR